MEAVDRIKVGDIFYTSWGYDQTNIAFFQVTRKTKKCVYIRELEATLKSSGNMSGSKKPIKNAFTEGSETLHRVRIGHDSEPIVINAEYDYDGYLWDGKPKTCSWYA